MRYQGRIGLCVCRCANILAAMSMAIGDTLFSDMTDMANASMDRINKFGSKSLCLMSTISILFQ